jgi:hypothetical protein
VYHYEGDSTALENMQVACCLLQSQGITKGCKCPFVCNLESNFLIVISLGLVAPERFFLLQGFLFVTKIMVFIYFDALLILVIFRFLPYSF